ncbi:hypothetical protein [Actinomadura madurae]|uniref:hypothetical protein n=1 Tax=Actinomadura madurae TaxID=1993 RepID=UPI000D98731A|nr:hypothetical protein [Actinomadura madurae]SPT58163.1 Uncharacterised protein [Actinomadura madurae]
MGAEHPTRTDTKVEAEEQSEASDQAPSLPRDQPGSPGQESRLESRAAAQQPYEPGTDEKRETPPPARSARAVDGNDPNTIGTPRADSMAIARGEKLETDENEPGASESDPPDTSKTRADGAEPPADDNPEPDNADPATLGEEDTEAPKPQEDQPPAPDTSRTEEPGDVTPEPDDGTGQTPPQPLAETSEAPREASPAPETGPDAEAPLAPPDGEPPVQAEHGDFEEPGPKEPMEAPAQEPGEEGAIGSGDGQHDHGRKSEDPAEPSVPEEPEDPAASLPTREALDPAGGEEDARPDLEEAEEDAPVGEDPAREHLYAFGNKKMPKLTRLDRDLRVESSDEIVGPYAPVSPTDRVLGKSTYVDPAMAPLTGHYHVLASDAEIPPGLGIHADGEDAGGIEPWGHRTIYPTEPMTAGEFTDRVAALQWEWAGNKKR